jgi:hypothetical protein
MRYIGIFKPEEVTKMNESDCRAHAAKCEELALKEPHAKNSYMDLAQKWRELADKLERMPKTKNGLDEIN